MFKGGQNGNLSVICGSPSETTTKTTLTVSSTTVITPSIEYTSVAFTDNNAEVTVSSNTVNSSFDSLSMDSTQDDPEMSCKYAIEESYHYDFKKVFSCFFLILFFCLSIVNKSYL